ncbi:CHAP domain-containing protein [bacterium 210820-DFI.6.37]|nr:CHAP domain-containing protein [bacterium 210820-DFI.6.37]
MKQRAAAGILLILAIFIFCGQIAARTPENGIRRQAPDKASRGGRFYYDEEMNPFYPKLAPYWKVKDGYINGNCTWYAWGRACEIAGKKLPHAFTGDAGTWWETNQREGWYPYGQEPKRGAVVCYRTHVAVVEQVSPLIVSESGWNVAKDRKNIVFHCGSPWRESETPKGYIYPE